MLMDVVRRDRGALLIEIPQLECHVVSTEDEAPILAECDVRYARNDLREERLICLSD